MKMLHALLVPFVSLPLCALGQGFLSFDNGNGSSGLTPVTISSALGTFNAADGPGGAYVGADYTASLYFLNGVVTNQAVFDNSSPILFAPANTLFYGITGIGPTHGPTVDGAGLFHKCWPWNLAIGIRAQGLSNTIARRVRNIQGKSKWSIR